ncbi:MAG: hypothetical protein P1U77_13270 [Rubripirellula sp.]|nr:hypothetical protein [Rubripirellula sp.]
MVNQVLVMPAMDGKGQSHQLNYNSSETAADHSEKQPIPNRRNSMHWNGVPKEIRSKSDSHF